MYTDNPVLDEIHRTSEWEEIQANNIGECIQCGQPIIKDTPAYEGDEYIETEDGLVHWECWRELRRKEGDGEMKWINMKERHPEKAGRYLTASDTGSIKISTYTPQEKDGYDGFAMKMRNGANRYRCSNILYWMPLPDLPEALKISEEEKNAPPRDHRTIRKLRAENEELKRLLKERERA